MVLTQPPAGGKGMGWRQRTRVSWRLDQDTLLRRGKGGRGTNANWIERLRGKLVGSPWAEQTGQACGFSFTSDQPPACPGRATLQVSWT